MKRKSRRGSSHLHQRKATVRPAGTTLHPSGTSEVMWCEEAADSGCLLLHVYADDMIIYCE